VTLLPEASNFTLLSSGRNLTLIAKDDGNVEQLSIEVTTVDGDVFSAGPYDIRVDEAPGSFIDGPRVIRRRSGHTASIPLAGEYLFHPSEIHRCQPSRTDTGPGSRSLFPLRLSGFPRIG